MQAKISVIVQTVMLENQEALIALKVAEIHLQDQEDQIGELLKDGGIIIRLGEVLVAKVLLLQGMIEDQIVIIEVVKNSIREDKSILNRPLRTRGLIS